MEPLYDPEQGAIAPAHKVLFFLRKLLGAVVVVVGALGAVYALMVTSCDLAGGT